MNEQSSLLEFASSDSKASESAASPVTCPVVCLGQTFPNDAARREHFTALLAEQPHKKLRVFRMEAVRTGFKQAWQGKDYQTIITVAEKIPPSVLEEDDKLLMWYDQAVTRIGG